MTEQEVVARWEANQHGEQSSLVTAADLQLGLEVLGDLVRQALTLRDKSIDDLEKRNRDLESRCRTTEARLAATEKRLTDQDAIQNSNRKHFDAVEKKIGELARGRNGNLA
jgi:hypothetical protein